MKNSTFGVMKKFILPLFAFFLLANSLQANYQKFKTLTNEAYYVGNALVEVDKSKDRFTVYSLDESLSVIATISPDKPSGYTLDSVFYIHQLGGSSIRYIYGVSKGSDKQVYICDDNGDKTQSFSNGVDVRFINTGWEEKVIVRSLTNGNWTSSVYELDRGGLDLEETYHTEYLGAFWYDFNNYGDGDYFHYFYVDKANNQILRYDDDHTNIGRVNYTVPSGYTARAFSESFFDDWIVNDNRADFAVYFENGSNNIAKLINSAGEIQTFSNAKNIDRFRNYNSGSPYAVLGVDVSTSSKDEWEMYTVDNSKSTNVATKQKTLPGRPIARNWAYTENDGFVLRDASKNKVAAYDIFFDEITANALFFNVNSNDEVKQWTLYYDGNADGDGSTQELYYINKLANGNKEFKISVGNTDLLKVANAEYFRTAPYFLSPGIFQILLWVPGTGTVIYRYDFSIPAVERIAPKDQVIDVDFNGVTFNWKSAKNALGYTVQVVTDTINNTNYHSEYVKDTFYTWLDADSSTTYYWSVLASNDAANAPTTPKRWWKFTTKDSKAKTPDLVSPANNSTGLSTFVNFIWNTALNAVEYEFELSTSVTFTTSTQITISDTVQLVSGLEYDETYYWRVRSVGKNNKSNWSTVYTFTTEKENSIPTPTLVSPSNGSTGVATVGEVECSSISGATGYTFDISESTAFVSMMRLQPTTNKASYQGLKPLTTYYWRAKVETSAGESGWSQVWSFTTKDLPQTVDAPKLISPANGATGLSLVPRLECENVSGANPYTYEWSTSSDFSNSLSKQSTMSNTLIDNLSLNTTYYWRAKVQTSDGVSDWSETWSFTTASEVVLDPPSLIKPSNNASGVDPANAVFEWSYVPAANSFEIQVSTDVNFNTFTTGSPSGTTLTLTSLAENTTYYWRVKAKNAARESDWSSISIFSTGIIGNVGQLSFSCLEIYPNPATEMVNLEFQEPIIAQTTASILTLQGQLLETIQITNQQEIINVGHLESGVYLIKIADAERMRVVRLVRE